MITRKECLANTFSGLLTVCVAVSFLFFCLSACDVSSVQASPITRQNSHRSVKKSLHKKAHRSVHHTARSREDAQKKAQASATPWFIPGNQTATQTTLHGKELQRNAIKAAKKLLPQVPSNSSSPSNVTLRRGVQQQGKDGRGDFHIGCDTETTTWSPRPIQRNRTDELIGIHEQHRLRAYTHLSDSDNLDIRAGPEFIIRNKKENRALDTQSNQPDSEVGVGMQFEYNF